jgi:gas vesicle protein
MKCFKFSAGLISGLVLGILIAPDKGQETRKKVKETAESWKHRLNNLFGKGENELDELKDILENEAKDLNHDVRQRLLKLIEENRKTYREAKQQSLS